MFTRSPYLKRIGSALLLVTLLFGTTPKIFLHHVFARHTDIKSGNNKDAYQISKGGYNCNQENLVAESAYEAAAYFSQNTITSYFKEYNECERFSFTSAVYFSFHLRGPPVSV